MNSELTLYAAVEDLPEPQRSQTAERVFRATERVVRAETKLARKKAFKRGFTFGLGTSVVAAAVIAWVAAGRRHSYYGRRERY